MTIILLKPYSSFAVGAQVTLDTSTEASVVAQGIASYVQANAGATGFSPLTAQEQQQLRASLTYYTGTWANRPAAASAPVNSQIAITDIGTGGYSRWFTDGTNWRPMNNKVMLWNRAQTIASPIATMAATGATIDFTLPDALTIPAGMLYAGMKVFAIAHVRRLAAAGAAGIAGVRLGNSATTINNNTFGQGTVSATSNRDIQIFGYAHIASASSYLASVTSMPNQPGTADYLDRSSVFDTTAVQYLSIGLGATATIDNFCVTSYAFWLEG